MDNTITSYMKYENDRSILVKYWSNKEIQTFYVSTIKTIQVSFAVI